MASTTTQTTIINRALQLVGYQSVGSISDNDRGARAMNRAYQPTLLKALRDYNWNFSIKRVSLAASVTKPAHSKANYFPLPGDFISLVHPDDTYNYNSIDWQIEGLQIASDDAGPLNIRYVSSNITDNMMDSSFAEALSAMLALNTCEELTQSNTKLASIAKIYDDAIKSAKKNNAFENRPSKPSTDSWLTIRS